MSVCPECGETVGPGLGSITWAYRYDVDDKGQRVEGSEQGALFHPTCWEQWKARHPELVADEREAEPCPDCDGIGSIRIDETGEAVPCIGCGGTGYLPGP